MIRVRIQQVWEGAVKRFTALGRSGETIVDRECVQHYGFTSRPLPGAEGIVIRKGNQIIMIASDDRRYRIALEDGEVCLYTDEGDRIHLARNQTIEIRSGRKIGITTKSMVLNAASDIRLSSPEIHTEGNVHVSTGATGTFSSLDRKMITVTDGIITEIQ